MNLVENNFHLDCDPMTGNIRWFTNAEYNKNLEFLNIPLL